VQEVLQPRDLDLALLELRFCESEALPVFDYGRGIGKHLPGSLQTLPATEGQFERIVGYGTYSRVPASIPG
jgi:hypothetical protein